MKIQQSPECTPGQLQPNQAGCTPIRKVLRWAGLILLALSALFFFVDAYNKAASVFQLHSAFVPTFEMAAPTQKLAVALLVLLVVALVITGILSLLDCNRLERIDPLNGRCFQNGLADILLAVALTLIASWTMLTLNVYSFYEMFETQAQMIVWRTLFIVLSLLLAFAAAMLYIVSSIRQKKKGETSSLALISGVSLLVYAVLQAMLSFIDSTIGSGSPFFIFALIIPIIATLLLCLAVAFRGLTLFNLCK